VVARVRVIHIKVRGDAEYIASSEHLASKQSGEKVLTTGLAGDDSSAESLGASDEQVLKDSIVPWLSRMVDVLTESGLQKELASPVHGSEGMRQGDAAGALRERAA